MYILGFILPGDTAKIEVKFRSKIAGHFTETWLLGTVPLIAAGAEIKFILKGMAIERKDYTQECLLIQVQSNFGRSNSPVSNTRDCSNSFVGPDNFPIHLMLKYTPGSNSDGSNAKHGPQGEFFM